MHRSPSRSWLVAVSALVTVAGCQDHKPQVADQAPAPAAAAWKDGSPHAEKAVTANGVRLELLDWGGSGPPLVLIHGLGDSPHIWDDLAPLLAADFHVLAYGRRGHAGSEKTGPYDNATLTADLVALLDSLHIDRAALVGWSMGGNEITEIARAHPKRVSALVYLDGAYDWSDPALVKAFGAIPTPLTPSPADQRSLDALRSWFQRAWIPDIPWPPSWEAHIRDLVDVQPDGSTRYRQTDSVNALMFESLVAYRRDYRAVHAPALALWAPTFLPGHKDDSVVAKQVADWERDFFAPYRAASIKRFRTELAGSRDSTLPNTNHATIGAVDVPGLARLIRDFIVASAK